MGHIWMSFLCYWAHGLLHIALCRLGITEHRRQTKAQTLVVDLGSCCHSLWLQPIAPYGHK